MKKLSVVLAAVVLAAVLLIAGALVGFDRGIDVGGTYLFSASLVDAFEVSEVEAILDEAGAKNYIVQNHLIDNGSGEYIDARAVTISFEANSAEEAVEIYNNAKELFSNKFFLSTCTDMSNMSSTLNKDAVVSMWPAIIVGIIMLAYVFIRFGVQLGIYAVINMFVTGVATLGIVGLLGIQITGYTIPALMIACAVAYGFTVVFALTLKGNLARIESKEMAIIESVNQHDKIVAVLSAVAAVGLAVVLIFGGSMLANFATTALIGVIINAAVVILVMPEMLNGSKKA